MNYIFWAFLVNIVTGLVSLFLPRIFGLDVSFIFSLVVFGLILKGISVLNQNQRNLMLAKTLAIILMAAACVNGLVSNLGSSSIDGSVILLLSSSGILSIILEYQLIKGYQSYATVLKDGQAPYRLLKYWKTNLVSSIIFGVALGITSFVVVFALMSFMDPSLIIEPTDLLLYDLQVYVEALSPNAPVLIFLLVVLVISLLIMVIARILWLVALYTIQKDHQQALKGLTILPVVE